MSVDEKTNIFKRTWDRFLNAGVRELVPEKDLQKVFYDQIRTKLVVDKALEASKCLYENQETSSAIYVDGYVAGHVEGRWELEERVRELEQIIRDLLDRIERNGGLGEYKGGQAFIVNKALKALHPEKGEED